MPPELSPPIPEDKPPNIDIYVEGSEELRTLRERITAPGAEAFLPRVTMACKLGGHYPLWGRVVAVLFCVPLIAGLFVLAFLIMTERLEPKGNEAVGLGLGVGLMAVLVLWGVMTQILARNYLLLAPDALGQCRGWRWRKSLRLIPRADIRSLSIFKVMRMSSSKGRRSREYQAAWGLRTAMADHTERALTPEKCGMSLQEEYEAYTWLGHRLARWAGTPFLDEAERTLADYTSEHEAASTENAGKTLNADIPSRVRLYPPNTSESREFAETFRPSEDMTALWPPAGTYGVAVSAPPWTFRKALGLITGGLLVAGIMAGAWRLGSSIILDLWPSKLDHWTDVFGLLFGSVFTVGFGIGLGIVALVAFGWWLSALMSAISRAKMLLTPDMLHLKSGGLWRRVRAIPRTSISEVKLEESGHGGSGDERKYVIWRLHLTDDQNRDIDVFSVERDHAVATWMKDLLMRWTAM